MPDFLACGLRLICCVCLNCHRGVVWVVSGGGAGGAKGEGGGDSDAEVIKLRSLKHLIYSKDKVCVQECV